MPLPLEVIVVSVGSFCCLVSVLAFICLSTQIKLLQNFFFIHFHFFVTNFKIKNVNAPIINILLKKLLTLSMLEFFFPQDLRLNFFSYFICDDILLLLLRHRLFPRAPFSARCTKHSSHEKPTIHRLWITAWTNRKMKYWHGSKYVNDNPMLNFLENFLRV